MVRMEWVNMGIIMQAEQATSKNLIKNIYELY